MLNMILNLQPIVCENIKRGNSTFILRKSKPKCKLPFKVYMYQSKGKEMLIDVIKDGDITWENDVHKGKILFLTCPKSMGIYGGKEMIVGEFIVDDIMNLVYNFDKKTYVKMPHSEDGMYRIQMSIKEVNRYGKRNPLYGWHITNFVEYNPPKHIKTLGTDNAPKNYSYIRKAVEYGDN